MSATAIPSPNPTSAAYSEYIDSQSFNVTSIDGTPLTISFDQLNSFINSIATQQAVYAFGVGFCGMLTVVLLLLTDRKKLRRPIYILNLSSLILYTFRSILQIIITCGVGGNFGEFFIGAQAQLTTAAYWPQITFYTIQPFLYACIVLSLVLQVRVVFAAEPTTQKIITGILFLGGLGIVVLEFIFCISALVSYARDPLQDNSLIDTLFPIIKEYFVTYVGLSCVIFLYKLAITIHRRRKMGIKKFGPLQIIFIMFSQCLVIPVIFYVIDLCSANYATFLNFDALGQVFLVCTLPLSALWASADAEGRTNRVEVPSFANVSGTDSASHAGKFSFFSRGKKSSQDSHSSYSTDIEKAPDYPHDGVAVHTTVHVKTTDPNGVSDN